MIDGESWRKEPLFIVRDLRRAMSDEHVFAETGLYTTCGSCYMPRSHMNHITTEEAKARDLAWRDRWRDLHGG